MPKRKTPHTITVAPIAYTGAPPTIINAPSMPIHRSHLKFCRCGTRNTSLPFVFDRCVACIMNSESHSKTKMEAFAKRKESILNKLTAFVYENKQMNVHVLMMTPKKQYEIVLIDSDTPESYITRVYDGQSILFESPKLIKLGALKIFCEKCEEFITKDG
jgi:hypothetical protein